MKLLVTTYAAKMVVRTATPIVILVYHCRQGGEGVQLKYLLRERGFDGAMQCP